MNIRTRRALTDKYALESVVQKPSTEGGNKSECLLLIENMAVHTVYTEVHWLLKL